MPRGFKDLPPELLASILAFIPCLKARLRLATVAKRWLAALASSDSYSRGCWQQHPIWSENPFAGVEFHGPDAPMLQQDVLAALAASGTEFWLSEAFKSWAWLPRSVRRLTFTHCPPADCPTLACVEEVQVEHLQDCTALDVTKFPSARVLKASFTDASQWELMKVPPADIPTTKVPWLEQLAALPQLARVEFTCFEFSPRNILAQLPAGCELVIHTDIRETLEDSLPRRASLPHLVSLHATISVPTYLPDVEFSCLAGCPNLREVQLSIDDYCGNCDFTDPTWVDLYTLKYLPTRCSVVLEFEDAAMHIGSYEPPADWSVAPYHDCEDLICFRHGSQQLLA